MSNVADTQIPYVNQPIVLITSLFNLYFENQLFAYFKLLLDV